MRPAAGLLLLVFGVLGSGAFGSGMVSWAAAQSLDLSHGGPLTVTATSGLEWRQQQQVVAATGNAQAVRDTVTVDADTLLAHYRKKAGGADPAAAVAASPAVAGTDPAAPDTGSTEIFRVEAEGNVRIHTPTDQAFADRATYDMDQAVLLMTGHALRLVTPQDTLTARDTLEYWSARHMAVARGDAVVITSDNRRVDADVLVAYTVPDAPAGAAVPKPAPARASADDPIHSGKLQKVEALGHVLVRTQTEIVTGDRAVYVPDTGIARLAGNVRITRGQTQLAGQEADVNMKTGISRLTAGGPGAGGSGSGGSSSGAVGPGAEGRVRGLIVPSDPANQGAAGAAGAGGAGGKPAKPPPAKGAS